jgi:hypothetical protein
MDCSNKPITKHFPPLRGGSFRTAIACLLIFVVLFVAFPVETHAQSNISIAGENSASYIYRTAKDSLNSYFENELNFRVDNKNFTFGMTFLAQLPRYDQFNATEELSQGQIHYEWVDRYIQLNFDDLKLTAGTLEESFGYGMTLRSWNDRDLVQDKRLEGASFVYSTDAIKVTGVYGALKNDVFEADISKNDLFLGADVDFKAYDFIRLGASLGQYKQKNPIWGRTDYIHKNVHGGRINLLFDRFDVSSEYAELVPTHNAPDYLSSGTAFFARANTYFDQFTISGGYKRYNRYDYQLSDLPTLNHYDELLLSFADVDFEEGLQGEIRWMPNFDNEILISYAESWDRSYTARHANFFTEYKRSFESFSTTLDYEHLERIDKNKDIWEQELRPAISMDFYELARPLMVKFMWGLYAEKLRETKTSYHRPYIQIDTIPIENVSVSISAEYQFADWDEFGKNSIYLGVEIVTSISNHSEVKLFAGKEKGGKVCRNGVCMFQSPFEGVRLTLNTRF